MNARTKRKVLYAEQNYDDGQAHFRACPHYRKWLSMLSDDKGIEYSYEIAENISFYANEDNIRQLTAILIDNAIKHTDSLLFFGTH